METGREVTPDDPVLGLDREQSAQSRLCYRAPMRNKDRCRELLALGLTGWLLACSTGNMPSPESAEKSDKPAADAVTTKASSSVAATNDKRDRIRVQTPSAGQRVQSPLEVVGQARGGWFFEASFPVLLLDANGQELARHYAQAQGEWMTEEFVPFTSTLTFAKPTTATGVLVLKKANASGLPEHDEELRIALRFDTSTQ